MFVGFSDHGSRPSQVGSQFAVDDHSDGPGEDLNDGEREAIRSCLEQLVAGAFQLDELMLRVPTRGQAKVARARQTAMYLAHTVCGLSLTEVGAVFDRDRTTVAHACRTIEEQREQPAFDRALEMLERSARIIHLHVFALEVPHTRWRVAS